MLVTPLPWTDRLHLVKVLSDLRTDAVNARSSTDLNRAYFQWCDKASWQLKSAVTQADLERLVLTQAYWTLLNSSMIGTPQINALRTRELDRCVADLEIAVKALQGQIDRWAARGRFVVPDTCFFMNYPNKFNELDYWELLSLDSRIDVHVVIPMPVVDELDGLKKSKIESRYRAGASLRIIQELFGDKPDQIRTLRGSEVRPGTNDRVAFRTAEVTVEILFDPPGHRRVEIMDDEIIRRATTLQPYAAVPITMLTYDTNMALRAKANEIAVKLLVEEKDLRDMEVSETIANWGSEIGTAEVSPGWPERATQLREWSRDPGLSGVTKNAAGSLLKQVDAGRN